MGETATRGNRKVVTGVVHKVSSEKTISVLVSRRVRHARYGKYVTRSRRYLVHDEKKEAGAGDMVEIMSTRPLSRTKCWRLVKVTEKVGAARAEVSG